MVCMFFSYFTKAWIRGFPGGPVVECTCRCRGHWFNPYPRRFHTHQGHVLPRSSPHTLSAPQQEEPPKREAHALQRRVAAARGSQRKAHRQQERPREAINQQINNFLSLKRMLGAVAWLRIIQSLPPDFVYWGTALGKAADLVTCLYSSSEIFQRSCLAEYHSLL